jgi:hypothetical protein
MKKYCLIISVLISLNVWAQQPTLFTFTPTNSSGIIYGQAQIDGNSASSNDWIAAFDASGNCCGASALVVNGGISYINLVIYGDDGTTPNIDEGMNGSEDFTLKLYQASSGLYIDYPSNSGATYFSGWLNTNGSPIPAYSNVTDIYNFLNTSNVTLSLNIQLCENGSSIQLIGGFPTGGIYFGNGVNGSVFDPTIAGDGNHTITYVVNGDSASSMATVYALPDATFTISGPFCDNESNILLTSVTSGGSYSGSGVISNTFSPDVVGAGSYWISYTLTDSNNCIQTEDLLISVNASPNIPQITQNIDVLECSSSGVSFQWLDATMSPISGEVNSSFYPSSNGMYYVEVSNGYCSEISESFQYSITSINQINSNITIEITDKIIIKNNMGLSFVIITDILGKQLFKTHFNKNLEIDIKQLNKNGIFLLYVWDSKNKLCKKFKL